MFKVTIRTITAIFLLFSIKILSAEKDLYFDTDFMNLSESESSDKKAEINNILRRNTLAPGRYLVLISINNKEYGQVQVEFYQHGEDLVPLIPVSVLHLAGVKPGKLVNKKNDQSGDLVDDVKSSIADAKVKFDTQNLKLSISIPQIYIDTVSKGYVPPTEWDAGINAGRINYQASAGKSYSPNGGRGSTANININSGINYDGWRARSSMAYQMGRPNQIYNTYIETDLPGTVGRLMFGELFTQGDVMESISFRGVQASSDVDMMPDSMQGYAPIIRGIAYSQAKVEVRQHGYSIYTAFVPQGPFEINDLNTASSNGDLEVIITEANGQVRRFTQPYATLGNLLRQGVWRYNVASGEYSAPDINENPKFVQLSGALGLTGDYTVSGATIIAEDYNAVQFGMGKGLGSLGALSVDITHSKNKSDNEFTNGQSYSIRYGKYFDQGTNLRFTGYRYSTGNYRSFTEAINERNQKNVGGYFQRRRNRLEANITQNIGDNSSIYTLFSQQDYWGSNIKERQAQIGFNTVIGKVNVGFYASKSLTKTDAKNQEAEISMNLSMPLGNESFNSSIARGSSGKYEKTIGLSGTAGELNKGNYNVDLLQPQSGPSQISVSAGYRMPWTQVNGGVTKNKKLQNINLGMAGSLLGHSGGIEAGQYLGETVALINVDETPDVDVQNNPGNPTNKRGYSIVPYLRPYRANRIVLDTRNTANDIVISGGVTEIIPRRGAIVKAHFHAIKVNQVFLNLTLSDGTYVPFGAVVKDSFDKKLTLVGQAGQALFASETKKIDLKISWGEKDDQTCDATIDTDDGLLMDGFNMIEATCLSSVK